MRPVLILFLMSFFYGSLFSQNNSLNLFSPGGGYFIGENMQQSWSLGEPVTEITTGPTMMFTQGFQQSDLYRNLYGRVTYDNGVHSPMRNTLILLQENSATFMQAYTNGIGYYEFQSLPNGSFPISGYCSKPWGGGNSIDALLIMKHFTGLNPLSGIRLAAADVNATGNVNSVDALQVMKRFVGLQSAFTLGDWVFDNHNVIVNGFSNLEDNFKGLCSGDVDGSFTPSNLKTEPMVNLADNGVLKLTEGEDIIVPLTIKENIRLAALSLVLYYPEDQVSIKSVTIPSENQNLVYNARNGELRLAWYTLKPLEIEAGGTLLNIFLKYESGTLNAGSTVKFTIGDESQLGDFSGNIIPDKTLEMPLLMPDDFGFYLSQNQPNPGSGITRINYSLPEPGKVQMIFSDLLGKETKVLMEGRFVEGSYHYDLDCSDIPAGVYMYSMRFVTHSQVYMSTRRMVVVH